MTAPADNYVVASGRGIYGGKAAPAVGTGNITLVPGELKSIHMNTLSSVGAPAGWQTEATGINGPWANWCGAVFSPDYSPLGAMVYWGGGHGGYDGTEFYLFNLSTQLWERRGVTIPYDFLPDTGADWCDVAYEDQFIPPASHTYSHAFYIPPEANGGPKGSYCLPYNVYGGGPGSGNGTVGFKPHRFDLATEKFTRYADNVYSPPYTYGAYGGGAYDTKRNIYWGMQGGESPYCVKIDCKLANPVVEPVGIYTPSAYFCPIYCEELDLILVTHIYGDGNRRITLTAFDCAGGKLPAQTTLHFDGVIQVADTNAAPGMDWCPDTKKFYLYQGVGANKLYVATPPANGDWKNGIWTWSIETMGGEEPVNLLEPTGYPPAQGPHVFTKWKYNPLLKAFMWSQGTVVRDSPDGVSRDGAFQLYRPLGVN